MALGVRPWRPLDPSNIIEKVLVRFLKLLIGLLGSACPLLGLIWSQNGLKNELKSRPNSVQHGERYLS